MTLKSDIENSLVYDTDVTWSELDTIIGDTTRIDENFNVVTFDAMDNKTDTEKYRIVLLVDWAADYIQDQVQYGMSLSTINSKTGLSLSDIGDQYIEEVATDRYRVIPNKVGDLVDAMNA